MVREVVLIASWLPLPGAIYDVELRISIRGICGMGYETFGNPRKVMPLVMGIGSLLTAGRTRLQYSLPAKWTAQADEADADQAVSIPVCTLC